jgi:hypothetical protein
LLTIKKKHEQAIKKYLKIKDTPWVFEKMLWKKVKKYNKIFTYIPGVLCVCVWNSLSMNAAHKDSDIDLFIITKNNRIWTTRIYFTLILTLLGQRKTARKHAWKFCLSFFITENHLSLETIAIKNDIYLKLWIKTLIPIVNKNNTFEKFQATNSVSLQLQNSHFVPFFTCLLNSLPFQGKEATNKIMQPSSLEKTSEERSINDYSEVVARRGDSEVSSIQKNTLFSKFCTILWDTCEKVLKTIFLPRTKKSFQKLWKPFWVIISDDILKFHDKDRRKKIRDVIFS